MLLGPRKPRFLPTFEERNGSETKKDETKRVFVTPHPRPGLDGPNALRWYGPLRGANSPLSVFNFNSNLLDYVAISSKDCSLLRIIVEYSQIQTDLRFEFDCNYIEH